MSSPRYIALRCQYPRYKRDYTHFDMEETMMNGWKLKQHGWVAMFLSIIFHRCERFYEYFSIIQIKVPCLYAIFGIAAEIPACRNPKYCSVIVKAETKFEEHQRSEKISDSRYCGMHKQLQPLVPAEYSYWWLNMDGYLQPSFTLQWRHNEHDGVSDHQSRDSFTQTFIQAQIKKNTKAPRHWALWGEFTGHRWIPRTKGQ